MNKKLTTTMLAGLLLMASAQQTNAATTSTTLDVTAFVGAACTVSVTPIVFNVLDPTGADTWTNGSVTITCNPGIPFEIAMDAGQNFDGVERRVHDGLGNYGLYALLNPDLGGVWGDNFSYPAPTLLSVASGGADIIPIDGVFLGGQFIPDGIYSDVVTVTVIY